MGLTALEVLFFMRNEMHMEKAIWKRNRYNERERKKEELEDE